jgi:hypothetical protein
VLFRSLQDALLGGKEGKLERVEGKLTINGKPLGEHLKGMFEAAPDFIAGPQKKVGTGANGANVAPVTKVEIKGGADRVESVIAAREAGVPEEEITAALDEQVDALEAKVLGRSKKKA